jgi:ParB family chromosome partitioning protein
MNMFEEARALRTMLSMLKMTQDEIAKIMGVSQPYVANKIRLLKFSERIQNLILEAGLTERHARFLLKLKDDKDIEMAIEKIKAMGLKVAETEVLVDNIITENLKNSIYTSDNENKLHTFEDTLSASVKALSEGGYRVEKKTDCFGDKKYITLAIKL